MLYVVLIAITFLRLFLVVVTPAEMGSASWIAMGAHRHQRGGRQPPSCPRTTRPGPPSSRASGPSPWDCPWCCDPYHRDLVDPLLAMFGMWRHGLRRYPPAYKPRLWSVVFSLGT